MTDTALAARTRTRDADRTTTTTAAIRFADLGISPRVVDALAKRGLTEAFPIQSLVMPDALAGRDILAKSRTGSGKTLAFAIPLVETLTPSDRAPTALILAPTRELASQVTEEFRAIADVRRLKVAAVYGGVGIGPQAKIARHSDIVIATPGRLLDLVARRLLRLDRVRTVVLDEADRMLDMGFLPDVRRILELLRPDRQTMLFSATLDGDIGRLAETHTRDAVRHEIKEDRPVVSMATHRFLAVENAGKFRALVRELFTVATAPALAGTGGLLEGDAQLDDLQQQVSENFLPTDALIEWTAPYEGKVDVSGVLAWVTPHPAAVPKRDGVRLRIYLEAERKLELVKEYADNAAAPVQLSGLAVGPRQRLYFLSSRPGRTSR